MSNRIERAARTPTLSGSWQLDLPSHPHGRIICLRRTSEQGKVRLLEHAFLVDENWPHRLVRAEVDLDAGLISIYALRRKDPRYQPLLKTVNIDSPSGNLLTDRQIR